PFQGESPIAVLTQHASEPPVPLSRRVKGLPPRFQQLVLRCLEKEPRARFSSMTKVREELDAVAAGIELPPPAPSLADAVQELDAAAAVEALRSGGKRTTLLVLLALFGVGAAAITGVALHEGSPPPSASASSAPVRALPTAPPEESSAPVEAEKT